MECVACHRTGFTADELREHVGGRRKPECAPLSTKELRLHLKHDFSDPVEAAQHLQDLGEESPDEDAIIAELRADVAALKAAAAKAAQGSAKAAQGSAKA